MQLASNGHSWLRVVFQPFLCWCSRSQVPRSMGPVFFCGGTGSAGSWGESPRSSGKGMRETWPSDNVKDARGRIAALRKL